MELDLIMDLEDTDVLIALVSSLLESTTPAPSQETILDALTRSNGDVDAAAKLVRSAPIAPPSRKRKRGSDIMSTWLSKSSEQSSTSSKPKSFIEPSSHVHTTDRPISPSPKKHRPPASAPAKPTVDLMTVLRQAPVSKFKEEIPRLPPLTLTTPELVAKHSTCTLHPSILPSELACRLFYTMIDESRNWQRNKWWLFDRVVESPHRTSFYARKTNGVDGDESWQEAAQFWSVFTYNPLITSS